MGQNTSYTLYGLQDNTTYRFVVRAYMSGIESGNSNEAAYSCNTGTAESSRNPFYQEGSSPTQPSTMAPPDNDMDVSLTPTLRSGEFYDPDSGDYHTRSRWQIYRMDNDACIFDSVSETALTNITVPSSTLECFTTYYWRVRYYDQDGNISPPSPATYFTTLQWDDDGSSPSMLSIDDGSGGSSGAGTSSGCFIQALMGGR